MPNRLHNNYSYDMLGPTGRTVQRKYCTLMSCQRTQMLSQAEFLVSIGQTNSDGKWHYTTNHKENKFCLAVINTNHNAQKMQRHALTLDACSRIASTLNN